MKTPPQQGDLEGLGQIRMFEAPASNPPYSSRARSEVAFSDQNTLSSAQGGDGSPQNLALGPSGSRK